MAKAKTSITTENRSGSAADAAAKEKRTEMPLSDLHPFEGHPFKVLDDELMEQTVESIKQIGVVSPLIVRPDPEGGFEILSGHRRLHAAQLAGLATVPVIVKEMDDDAAIIFMVDSNLQRENILPSERAFSYKMKLEAMKHQGTRNDLETTSRQVVGKLEAADTIGEQTGESGRQVQRFIRLTNLIPEILDMVDTHVLFYRHRIFLHRHAALFLTFRRSGSVPAVRKEKRMYFDAKEFGKRLHDVRTSRGITQEELAVRLGLASKQHVSRMENGERSCSIDLLIELSCILHVSTDYLLMGSEPSKEEVKNDLLSIISELSTIAKKI